MGKRDVHKLTLLLPGAVSVVVVLTAWQIAAAAGWISGYRFPAPSRIVATWEELATVGFPDGVNLWTHVVATLKRILEGYILAVGLAVPLGIVIGAVSSLDRLTFPIITFARSVATLSLLPLVILWFGAGELAKVLLIAYGCFWVMLTNAVAAVKYVDPMYIRAARTLDTGRFGIFIRVVLPAALPRLFAGARIALGVGFMVIVGAEMIGTVKGLGALIMEARRFYRTDITIAGMITIGMIGFVISNSLAWLERFALPWNRGLDEVRR
jgi:ABC-type nitrate/sulfonate/bicarbonate transport system permease component